MTQKQREAYDGADRIDSDPFGLWDRDNRNHQKKLRIIHEYTAADPGDAILEVGCGDGTHAEQLDETYCYTGVDLSPSLVAETRSRIDNGRVYQADARDLPLADNSHTAVIGTAVLHHLPDAGAALEEWARVADESVTLMEPNYWFPKDWLTAHLVPEEQHKTQMAPPRLRSRLADLNVTGWTLEPRLYTPPWPAQAGFVYDIVDRVGRAVPGVRALGQMLLIHVEV